MFSVCVFLFLPPKTSRGQTRNGKTVSIQPRRRTSSLLEELGVVVIHSIKKIDRKSKKQQAKDEVRQQYVGRKETFVRGIISQVFHVVRFQHSSSGTLSQSATQQLTNNPLLFE
jgi:hypothetical protein